MKKIMIDPNYFIRYSIMNNLRSALGKQGDTPENSLSRPGSKPFPKGKNASIWAIDPQDEQNPTEGKEKNHQTLLSLLRKQLEVVYIKDAVFSQMSFYEIIESLQGSTEGMEELEYLQILQSSGCKASQFEEGGQQEFVEGFYEYLNRRIKKLKKKEKKNELQEYQKIVKTTFKKKGAVQFIDEDNLEKPQLNKKAKKTSEREGSKNEGSASKLNGSNSSTQGNKLGQLLSSSKLKDEKAHHSDHNQASVTFSAIVSQNVTVRQRETRQKKKDKKQQQENQEDEKHKDEGNGNNEGFIFYRPKAGKTK